METEGPTNGKSGADLFEEPPISTIGGEYNSEQPGEATRSLDDAVVDMPDERYQGIRAAQRKNEMEDIDHTLANLEKRKKEIIAKTKETKDIKELEKEIRDALGEVKGARRLWYEAAKFIGQNLYRKDVLRRKEILETKREKINLDIANYESRLSNKFDDKEDVPISKKGLEKQVEEYITMCRGSRYAISKINAMQKGIFKDIGETDNEIEQYEELLEADAGNEQYSNLLSYFTSQKQSLIDDLSKLAEKKDTAKDELKRWHQMRSVKDVIKQLYINSIKSGKKLAIQLDTTIELMDVYLSDCNDFQSLYDFNSGLKSTSKELDEAREATRRISDGIKGISESTSEELRRADKQYEIDLSSSNWQATPVALAEESSEMKKLMEIYK